MDPNQIGKIMVFVQMMWLKNSNNIAADVCA
jgi:hypothetical protein